MTGGIAIEGLAAPAEIRVDAWGIPHIRAASEADLFLAQGFNAARDRLWQIDLWRKRGLGRLAASFGPGYLAQDIASRHLLFRGDMEAEWLAYAPDTRAICEAFVAGVNGYIAWAMDDPARLPPEFALTGSAPEPWAAEDVVRIRSHALTRNAISEVIRNQILAGLDAETDLLRKNLEPRVTPGDTGIAPGSVPMAVLDTFRLGTAGVSFSPERLAATLPEAQRWRRVDSLAQVVADTTWTGSNNWAVAATRTSTGRPVMAGDPHRAHGLPSLRYLVHLTAPGLDVIGAGEPAVPGISMGHNGTAAFTQTIFPADQEDIFVLSLDPANRARYRQGDGWESFEEVTEQIEVKGAPAQPCTLLFSRHGPVLHMGEGHAYALRSVWFEPGSAAYLGGLSTMRAKTLPAFRDGLRRFATPSLNHLYADVSGTIAWQPAGMIPVRRGWDGLMPVPGDGSLDWDGFLSLDDLPMLRDPQEGFVASANEANLPPDWDHTAVQVGYEWLESSRALRLRAALASGTHDVADACALQTDVLSLPGLRLKALVAALPDAPAEARALFADWDGRMDVDSAAGALCELWWEQHLKPGLLARLVPDEALRALFAPGDVEGILSALERPAALFGPAPEAARDALLAETLAQAVTALHALQGPVADWRWGGLHHGYFEHPLTQLRAGLDIGPLEKPGSASTVMHAAYRGSDFRVTTGASVRFVLDVGNWDASLCINAPGQSGDPRSEHYADLAPLWATGAYVPFLYSDAAVEAATRQRITLVPAG
ncbi:penicillin acylase family protein [Paroceanicella profunda]|uniref:Penicillin acylase family protein n=2 Tax=Paroceanicella profunda TaxID=2579971 RepID=A0A5B8FYD7_9RHOB|nr:penicillin acylase family protein [Paroceanicella profunda]